MFPLLFLLYYREGVSIAPKYIWMMMIDTLLFWYSSEIEDKKKIPGRMTGNHTSYCVSQHEWMEINYERIFKIGLLSIFFYI